MIETRLQELGIELPLPSQSLANYLPYIKVGSLVFLSGQLPTWNGAIKYTGKIGRDWTVEEGREAARICLFNLLAQLKIACEGDLNQVLRCVRLGGFVNCTDDFTDHAKVLNGASDLMIAIFGKKGHHSRAAVGVNSLPLGASVELEAIFEVEKP
ncbi:MAG: RidA family protein [Alphaproteobacteria bacterium]|nr:RidA family protein [Alphaproteobacteria bacterium]